jgi:hypothetical protein
MADSFLDWGKARETLFPNAPQHCETNSWTIGPAQDAEIPDLMKFWRSGPTGPTIFVNSVIVKKANFQNIFYYFSIL